MLKIYGPFSYKSQAASCPQSMIWKESYWANRAEQARATVESIRNPECRRIVREIAVSFDPWQSLRATSRAVRGHRRRCRDPKRLRGIEPHPLVRKRTVPLIGEWSLDLCSSVAACRSEPGMKAQQAIEGAPLGADTFSRLSARRLTKRGRNSPPSLLAGAVRQGVQPS